MARPNEAPNRGTLKLLRRGLGLLADLLTVGLAVWKWILLVAAGIAVVVAFIWKARSDAIPAWTVFAGLGVLVVLGLTLWLGVRLGARRATANAALPEDASGHEAAAAIATEYLQAIVNSLDMLRDALAEPQSARRLLDQMKNGIFSTIQLSLSTRDDQIQCAFFRLSGDGKNSFLKTRHGDYAGHKKKVVQRHLHADGRSIAGCAFTSGEPVYCSNAATDKRFQEIDPNDPIRSVFCAPAIGAGIGAEPVGVLSISSRRVDAFSENDRTFVSICASALAGGELLRARIPADTSPPAKNDRTVQELSRSGESPDEEPEEPVLPAEA